MTPKRPEPLQHAGAKTARRRRPPPPPPRPAPAPAPAAHEEGHRGHNRPNRRPRSSREAPRPDAPADKAASCSGEDASGDSRAPALPPSPAAAARCALPIPPRPGVGVPNMRSARAPALPGVADGLFLTLGELGGSVPDTRSVAAAAPSNSKPAARSCSARAAGSLCALNSARCLPAHTPSGPLCADGAQCPCSL